MEVYQKKKCSARIKMDKPMTAIVHVNEFEEDSNHELQLEEIEEDGNNELQLEEIECEDNTKESDCSVISINLGNEEEQNSDIDIDSTEIDKLMKLINS
ncbi:hypothetical protein QTP88_010887 [Uroleucon formosanum]